MRWRSRAERGSATAEFAIAMPAALLVLAVALGGVQLAGMRVRLEAGAAEAARLIARGDSAAPIAARLDASLTRSDRAGLVCVRLAAAGPLRIRVAGQGCALEGGR